MYKNLVRFIWISTVGLVLLIAIHFTFVNYNFLYLYGTMPSLEVLENPKSELASELYSGDGALLGKYFRENRSPVEFEEISPNMINALVATEDARFYEHSGIDLKGTFAILGSILAGDPRGSSTISQQLAKNLFETRGEAYEGPMSKLPIIKTAIIKTKEWLSAIKIERSYTKREIMTMYLNTVDFGSNAYGIKSASQTFFGTTPDKLKAQEAAMLVGLLKAPSRYSPVLNPPRALARRNTVLEQMQKYKFINSDQCDSLKLLPIDLKYTVENQNKGNATYFRTVVHNYLIGWCKTRGIDLYADGLKVYTTIDSKLQAHAEEAVNKHMKYIQGEFDNFWKGRNPWIDESGKEIPNFIQTVAKRTERYRSLMLTYDGNIDSVNYWMNKKIRMKVFTWAGEKDTLFSPIDSIKYYKRFLQAGMLSMDPRSGHIKAWVGGVDHKYFKFDHVKQGRRQPGSTFKPFTYLAALDNGYSPCFEIQDAPVTFQYQNGGQMLTWTPQNSEGEFTGKTFTLRQAMARSINSITANVMKRVGPQTVVDYCKKLGIKSPLDPVPALCLGSSDVTVYELVGAYGAFANHGVYTEPIFITRIEDKNGNVLQEFTPNSKEAINEETAYLMLYMLKGGTEEKGGTALGLRRYHIFDGNDVGGKTGTTSNFSDGWFMGVTKSLVTGVWVGGDDRSIHFTTYTFGQGSKLALPIVGAYLEKAYNDESIGLERGYFDKPSKPMTVEINCGKYKNSSGGTDSTANENIYSKPAAPDLDL